MAHGVLSTRRSMRSDSATPPEVVGAPLAVRLRLVLGLALACWALIGLAALASLR